MTKAIQQSMEFPVLPKEAFETYMDSKKHTASTGMSAKISRRIGGAWHAFGKSIGGKNLMIVPNRMIVQAWRADHWKKTDADSILTITFTKMVRGTRVDLVHVNVPQHDHRGVTDGWHDYYWKPWKKYFAQSKKKKEA